MTVVITFDTSKFSGNDDLTVRLKSTNNTNGSHNDDDYILASVNVKGLAGAIHTTSVNIQLILLWDLYITNRAVPTTTTTP